MPGGLAAVHCAGRQDSPTVMATAFSGAPTERESRIAIFPVLVVEHRYSPRYNRIMDEDVEHVWIEEQQAAGLCPVQAARERAFVLAMAGSSQGREAWLRLAERAAGLEASRLG